MATTPTWRTPPSYHTAYNPAIFEAKLNDQDIETVTLKIYDAKTGALFQSMKAETYRGSARFDVSSVVRTAFARLSSGGEPTYDRALSFSYRAEGPGSVNLGTFTAVNAVAQVGESPDLSSWLNKALTRFERLYHYDGYELTVSSLRSGAVARDSAGPGTVSGKAVVSACTPAQPFYVRWINQQGGVDYWMFSRRQEFEQSVKSVSSFEEIVDDVENAATNSRAYGISAENRVTVGADNVPKADYDVLRKLPFAPTIEWYNEDLGKWIALLPSKFTGKMRTSDRSHSIEIQFDLPRLNLQY